MVLELIPSPVFTDVEFPLFLRVLNDERGLSEGRMKDCDRNNRRMS